MDFNIPPGSVVSPRWRTSHCGTTAATEVSAGTGQTTRCRWAASRWCSQGLAAPTAAPPCASCASTRRCPAVGPPPPRPAPASLREGEEPCYSSTNQAALPRSGPPRPQGPRPPPVATSAAATTRSVCTAPVAGGGSWNLMAPPSRWPTGVPRSTERTSSLPLHLLSPLPPPSLQP